MSKNPTIRRCFAAEQLRNGYAKRSHIVCELVKADDAAAKWKFSSQFGNSLIEQWF